MPAQTPSSWDGPPRKAVPRKPLRNQVTGKMGQRVLARGTQRGVPGGTGWDPTKVAPLRDWSK